MTAGERLRRLVRSVGSAVRLGAQDPLSLLLTVRMGAWVVFITVIARLLPLPTTFRLAEPRRRWAPSARLPAEEIARRIDRVFHAGLVTDGSCWKRAAVLRRYLLLNGVETDVVFGVRRESGGALEGHAWLERERVPFLEPEPPERYTVTFRHPAR
ncbi:MAG: lasso peptide biosynthesis B2 protein [Thermoanaerobaculia bacterium]